MGADDEAVKARTKFADSQCFSHPSFGILSKDISELSRPGTTERQFIDALKAQFGAWKARPDAFLAEMAGCHERMKANTAKQ